MRRILLAAVAFAFAGAGSALAVDTASIPINAVNPPVCDIVASSPNITLLGVDVPVAGNFQYTCNFIGDPTLTFQSANGGVKTLENGGGTANYGIWLNTLAPGVPPSGWLQASGATGGGVTYLGGALGSGITSSTAANSIVTPVFQVGLSTAMPVAGTYSDLLTITINP